MNRNLVAVIFFTSIMVFSSVGTASKIISEHVKMPSIDKILQPNSTDDSDDDDQNNDDNHDNTDIEDHDDDHDNDREHEDDDD